MGWLIALGALGLLAVMPLGVQAAYDSGGLTVNLVIGPTKVQVFPRKRAKKEKARPERKAPKPAQKAAGGSQKQKQGGSIHDFEGILRRILAFLGHFRRKLVIRNLKMKLIMAGSDPCDLAVNYGKTWAALGNVLPLLERIFRIRNRNIEVACDFCGEQTTVVAEIDIVISLGRLLSLVTVHGLHILSEFIKLKNLRKGGN